MRDDAEMRNALMKTVERMVDSGSFINGLIRRYKGMVRFQLNDERKASKKDYERWK